MRVTNRTAKRRYGKMNNWRFKMARKLYRSEKEKMIGGVCGGLAEYLDVDPTVMRVIFVLLGMLGGHGILLYIILWFIMPPESRVNKAP